MRARRAFQPTVELMPLRLAPGDLGTMLHPMDPVSSIPSNNPPFNNPMEPTSSPSGPSSGDTSILDAGSSTPPTGGHIIQLS
jgi:hypothetical protein